MRKICTRLFSFLLAAVLGWTFIIPSKIATVAAATEDTQDLYQVMDSMKQKAVSASLKKAQPEEWNRNEFKAYQFSSAEELLEYMLTGGIKYYTNKFNAPDRMVKITVADPGTFMITGSYEGTGKMLLYNANKKYLTALSNDDNDEGYYQLKVKTGDVFYVRMPSDMKKGLLMAYVLKDDIASYKADEVYIQSGKGTPTYHQFTIKKRSKVTLEVTPVEKKSSNVTYYLQKKVHGKWTKIGNTNTVKASSEDECMYGLQPGTYRVVLCTSTSQGVVIGFSASSVGKKVAFKKSKAQTIKMDGQRTNLYSTGETAERWYKVVKKTKKGKLYFGSDVSSGGFKFTVYESGKKKPIKTVKVSGTKARSYKLPKKTGTYYIKVSKQTKKTNGTYGISLY